MCNQIYLLKSKCIKMCAVRQIDAKQAWDYVLNNNFFPLEFGPHNAQSGGKFRS